MGYPLGVEDDGLAVGEDADGMVWEKVLHPSEDHRGVDSRVLVDEERRARFAPGFLIHPGL